MDSDCFGFVFCYWDKGLLWSLSLDLLFLECYSDYSCSYYRFKAPAPYFPIFPETNLDFDGKIYFFMLIFDSKLFLFLNDVGSVSYSLSS